MFVINGIEWKIEFVHSANGKLMRSDGSISLAVTDWNELYAQMEECGQKRHEPQKLHGKQRASQRQYARRQGCKDA